ncbi:MAG: hypothetical protein U9Q62_00090 [Campylobacterota bacterium]|nr:hypothetical protein [Campylobacterota bacterium]
MTGSMKITYTVLCDNDLDKSITVKQLLKNEKVTKAIKSAFAPQLRNIELLSLADECLKIATIKKEYTFEISKDDFADALTLAEEDARKRKLFKKGCDRVELIDIVTV